MPLGLLPITGCILKCLCMRMPNAWPASNGWLHFISAGTWDMQTAGPAQLSELFLQSQFCSKAALKKSAGWMDRLCLGLARTVYIYAPYLTVYLVIPLPNIPYIYGSSQPYL